MELGWNGSESIEVGVEGLERGDERQEEVVLGQMEGEGWLSYD